MKSFFEEHGKTLLVVIVVVALITLTSTIKADSIKEKFNAWIQTLSNSGNNAMEKIDANLPQTELPVKGDIITIEGKQYKVLSMNGTQAKVLGMFAATTSSNQTGYVMWDNSSNNYDGSFIDTYLNETWYGEQSQTLKDAIVPQDLIQSVTYTDLSWEPVSGDTFYTYEVTYNYGDSTETRTKWIIVYDEQRTANNKNVYLLDVMDIFEYLNVTPSNTVSWTSNNLNEMMFNGQPELLEISYLRSAANPGDTAAFVSSWMELSCDFMNGAYLEYLARPAFVIDLTKCEYTK